MAESGFLAGVVGCGRIGSLYDAPGGGPGVYTHAGMYRATPGLRLACGADADPENARRFAERWGCADVFGDVATMLARRPVDVLSVTTPDATHEDVVRQALGAERPPRIIFLEKPLAGTAAAGERLLAEAEKAGVLLLVNYVRRFDRMHRELRDLVRDGGIGKPRLVTGYYVRGLRHNGCHLVNLMRFLAGEIVEAHPVGPVGGGSLAGDPALHARVVFAGGAEGLLVALDRPGYAYSLFDLDLFGDTGRLRLTADGARAELYPARPDPRFTNFRTLDPVPRVFASTYETAMLEAGAALVRLLAEPGGPVENHGEQAVADLRIIEALSPAAAPGGEQ